MQRKLVIALGAILAIASFSACDRVYEPVSRHVAAGNEAYAAGDYDKALDEYREAQIDAPNDKRIALNIGDALFAKGSYAEAEQAYSEALAGSDLTTREKAAYNVGNARFKQQRLKEAVEAYQRALELNPDDQDAKFNLELAQLMLNQAAQQSEQQQQQEQPKVSEWALRRIREAEELARRGKYGEALRKVQQTLQAEAAAQQKFADFAERLTDLYRIFNR